MCWPKMGKTPYNVNKLNNLRFSDEELNDLNYQERCNLLNNLWLSIFTTELKYFSKKSYLMLFWGKQNIMLFLSNIKIEVAYMSIHLYGFSMHQILKIKCLHRVNWQKKMPSFQTPMAIILLWRRLYSKTTWF